MHGEKKVRTTTDYFSIQIMCRNDKCHTVTFYVESHNTCLSAVATGGYKMTSVVQCYCVSFLQLRLTTAPLLLFIFLSPAKDAMDSL